MIHWPEIRKQILPLPSFLYLILLDPAFNLSTSSSLNILPRIEKGPIGCALGATHCGCPLLGSLGTGRHSGLPLQTTD